MFAAESRVAIPDSFQLGCNSVLESSAVHFSNKVLLQIRLNGELDTCLEVKSKGLPTSSLQTGSLGEHFSEGQSQQAEGSGETYDDEDLENFTPAEDSLSNFQISTRLGDSNDMKLPIVCSQIAELYYKAVFPANADQLRDVAPVRDFVISLSAKFFRKSSSDNEFQTLLFILQAIKNMYL
ncbi:LAME_0C03158g1_1 [Lachancea meyersii CBS 8951]|uniref:LAME_0C03158g1_1 n=1 Tax=Lachancea meyersii CBS 8951 TaxID=1266667 RepID=A0A1G4IZY6_9SACH|nr:LAME_0C03158g1_1 [Lachancea meyersii CBS 8951]